jgi:hypothetical protein
MRSRPLQGLVEEHIIALAGSTGKKKHHKPYPTSLERQHRDELVAGAADW